MHEHLEPELRKEGDGEDGVGARGIEDVPGSSHHAELERLRGQTTFTLTDAARISRLLKL